jgi:two-component system OmpR family response regulator
MRSKQVRQKCGYERIAYGEIMTTNLQKIAYVEDDPDIQFITKLALESGGFQVLACSSGQEILEQALGFAPDLFLLDVMMPGLDGPATLQALKRIPGLANVPVIFMTAKVQPHEVEQYKKMALSVIFKPFDPVSLANEVKTIWERAYHV